MLWILTVVFLFWCNNKSVEDENLGESSELIETNDTIDVVDWDSEVDLAVSLDAEELDNIDLELFPKSYTYKTYTKGDFTLVDTGTYTYPEDVDHDLLLPIQEGMAKRDVVNSYSEDWMIYTSVDITLQDGRMFSVLYVNDEETNKYISASLDSSTGTTLYSFHY